MSNDAKIINDPDDVRTPDAPPSPVSPHLESTPNQRRADKTTIISADALALVGWTGLAFALTLINVGAGLAVKLPPYPTVGVHVLALLYLAAVLLALMQAARAASRLQQGTGFLLGIGGLLAIPLLCDISLVPLPYQLSLIAKNLLGVFAGALTGTAIGRIVKHPNTLLAAAGFALFFDIVVVTMGTVQQAAQNNSRLIAAVSIGAGSGLNDLPPGAVHRVVEPISGVTIGPADVLFLAFFLAAVGALSLSRRATFAWIYVLLLSALIIVETVPLPAWLPGIPALVPMGIAVIIANRRHGAFTQQEKRDLKIGAVFAVFCAALMVFGARALIKPAPKQAAQNPLEFQAGPIRFGPIGPNLPLYVSKVEPSYDAEKAGIRPGDAILKLNGYITSKLSPAQVNALIAQGRRNDLKVIFRHKDEVKENTAFLRLKPVASPTP